MVPALYRSSHRCPTAASWSLAPVTCEVSQIRLAGAHVFFFLGICHFHPLTTQNDGPKIPNKKNLEPVLGLTNVSVVRA